MDVTPAQLSLDLGISQKSIRSYLRGEYGPLSDGVDRWELDESQVARLRERFQAAGSNTPTWTLEPGDRVLRREIHRAYGGQEQGGISTPRSVSDILIFTDPRTGARYGYDAFEGLREDGSYSYTGEGQRGEQTFTRGNRALRESRTKDRKLRLFRTEGTHATYVGSFTLDDPPYRYETLPDMDGEPRTGIVFNLIPLDAQVDLLPPFGGLDAHEGRATNQPQIGIWYPPEFSDFEVNDRNMAPDGNKLVSRQEFQLQAEFGLWLERSGEDPRRLRLRSGASIIEPDFYIPGLKWIVEAKKSSSREHVRTAIGQVLDYVHVARAVGIEAVPVILLPGEPQTDLMSLCVLLGISIIVPNETVFVEVTASNSTRS